MRGRAVGRACGRTGGSGPEHESYTLPQQPYEIDLRERAPRSAASAQIARARAGGTRQTPGK